MHFTGRQESSVNTTAVGGIAYKCVYLRLASDLKCEHYAALGLFIDVLPSSQTRGLALGGVGQGRKPAALGTGPKAQSGQAEGEV